MNVIISIKPEYFQKIIVHEKCFEFRKTRFRREDIKNIYFYVTSPVKKITTFYKYNGYLFGEKEMIWQETSKYAGITYIVFSNYFINYKNAIALKIGKIEYCDIAIDPYKVIKNFRAPQSFMYIKDTL